MKYQVEVEGRRFEIEVRPDGTVWVDGRPVSADLEGLEGPFLSLLLGTRSYEVAVEETEGKCRVIVGGHACRTAVEAPRTIPIEAAGVCPAVVDSCQVTAPLPGLLVDVRVSEGQCVEAGTVVAVMESMKMHLELRAPQSGIIHSLPATPGREVQKGEVLAVIRPSA